MLKRSYAALALVICALGTVTCTTRSPVSPEVESPWSVADSTPPPVLHLWSADGWPWTPDSGILAVGGLVTWHSQRDLTIHISHDLTAFYDSVLVTGGSGSIRLDTGGTYTYCDNCFDPGTNGRILVR